MSFSVQSGIFVMLHDRVNAPKWRRKIDHKAHFNLCSNGDRVHHTGRIMKPSN